MTLNPIHMENKYRRQGAKMRVRFFCKGRFPCVAGGSLVTLKHLRQPPNRCFLFGNRLDFATPHSS